MQNKLTLSPEDIAGVERAMTRLSGEEYPKVRVADPAKEIGGIPVYGQRVDWFRLCQYKREIGHDFLPPNVELALFERGVNIAASRLRLVAIRAVLPADSLHTEGSGAAIRTRAISSVAGTSEYVQTFDTDYGWPDSREHVRGDTALMLASPKGQQPFGKEVRLYRFVTKHELTPEDMASLADLFSQAQMKPKADNLVPSTEEVMAIAKLLRDIDNFGSGANEG